MNARDLQTKASKETKFESPNFPKDPKNKKSLWDKLTDLSLSSTSDRIKFLFVFVLTGLGGILIGDVFKLILMKGTGIAFGIIGWSFIVVGFIGPLFKFLDEHQ